MIEPRLLARVARKKAQLDTLRPLPPAILRRLTDELRVEWTYHSNAIEGNTLTLRETQLILETGLTVGGKSLREHLEVVNHREAIDFVEALARAGEAVTPFQVRQIHRLVLARLDDAHAGVYRQVPVRISGASHLPPEPWEVPPQMDEWGQWLAGEAQALHPVARAARAHHRLAAIHPFVDGNGRTARLVMNLLLLREGFPPTILLQEQRARYYQVLAQADRGQPSPLDTFVARAVENSLTLFLQAATPQPTPPPPDERWLPLREAATGTPYRAATLARLARDGQLEALKRGRQWLTTRRAIADYQDAVAQK